MYPILRRNVIMIRVFKPKSLYPRDDNNLVEIEELNLDSPEGYLNFCKTMNVDRYFYRSQENGGSEADWQWLGIKNPYPDDEIMSQAAFMFFMNNAVNTQYGGTGLIVCSDENNFAYCIDKNTSKELDGQLECLQAGTQQQIK